MNLTDPLASALRSQRDSLAAGAPEPEFAALWNAVAARRERKLQRFLILAAAVPTFILFAAGLVALLLGGGLASGVPLVAVALWLAVNGAGAPLGRAADGQGRHALAE